MNAKSKSKQLSHGSCTPCVRLQLVRPDAREIFIAGSFNDWHPSVTPMIRLKDGLWAKELFLAPGRYEYRFVVDGQWADDPSAKELIPNPFGSANAVLEVPPAAPAAKVAAESSATPALPRRRQATTQIRSKAVTSSGPNTAMLVREKFPSLALIRITERY
jgi:hypothetical protein